MDLYKEIVKLKDDLLEYESMDFSFSEYQPIGKIFTGYDPVKIHQLQEGLGFLKNDVAKPLIEILSKSISIDDIYSEIGYKDFNTSIRTIFNPIIKLQVAKNFNLNIRVVELIGESNNLNINYIIKDIEAMEEAYINKNYGSVNTHSLSALQSLFKEICKENDIEIEENIKMSKLTSEALKILNMNAKEYTKTPDSQKLISQINKSLQTLGEIRNVYSKAHGSDSVTLDNFNNIPEHHYHLIMDVTKTLCNFIIASYDFQNNKESNKQV